MKCKNNKTNVLQYVLICSRSSSVNLFYVNSLDSKHIQMSNPVGKTEILKLGKSPNIS